VPGATPRPPHDRASDAIEPLAEDRWRDSERYLFGVDLYNQGFFWEAHEAWEALWRAAEDARQELFLQGLIQCAAACLKLRMREPAGFASLASSGTEKLERVAEECAAYMGLEVASFAKRFRAFAAGAARAGAGDPRSIDARPRLVLDSGS
jgi:predicted metal-dependent hydrolase